MDILDIKKLYFNNISNISSANFLEEEYSKFDVNKLHAGYLKMDYKSLQNQAEKSILKFFHLTSKRVPAYKDFLHKADINPDRIKTLKDFRNVPWIDKKNYLNNYALNEFCVDGKVFYNETISVSSGSSGKPFFWPRGTYQELETSLLFESAFQEFFNIKKFKTLLVNSFALGMYVGGIFTSNIGFRLAKKGYPLVVVNPGNYKEDVLRIMRELHQHFDQIIFAGYPPFLKDVLDSFTPDDTVYKNKIRLFFAGEAISETWRKRVSESLGEKNFFNFSISGYGTADAGMLATETPTSIFIKSILDTQEFSFADLIHNPNNVGRHFSLFQFDPRLRFFETTEKNELLISIYGGIPLVKYNIHDQGGILSFEEIQSVFRTHDIDIETRSSVSTGQGVWKLPFIYLLGRSDQTVILYGANIYPENVKEILENTELSEDSTGRFFMWKDENKKTMRPNFNVHIELKKGILNTTRRCQKFIKVITNKLVSINREYFDVYHKYGEKLSRPKLVLHEYQAGLFSKHDIKQRWVPRQLNKT